MVVAASADPGKRPILILISIGSRMLELCPRSAAPPIGHAHTLHTAHQFCTREHVSKHLQTRECLAAWWRWPGLQLQCDISTGAESELGPVQCRCGTTGQGPRPEVVSYRLLVTMIQDTATAAAACPGSLSTVATK